MDTDRRDKLGNRLKVGIGLLAALIIAPFTYLILQGIVGGLALLLAAAVGITVVQLAPAFGFMLANLRMKLIRSEAERNPIETMQNVYLEKSQIIRDKDNRIVEFEGRLADYDAKMQGFAKRYPEEAAKYNDVSNKMHRALEMMKSKQQEAKRLQKDYHDEIDKAKAIYAMALAAHDVTELAGSAAQDVYLDIKQQVSFDSVTHKFNTAVAALSVEVDTGSEYAALPPGKSPVINAEIVREKEKVLR
jgi:hypothetical protein